MPALAPILKRLVPTSVTKLSVSTALAQSTTGTPCIIARSTGADKRGRAHRHQNQRVRFLRQQVFHLWYLHIGAGLRVTVKQF